MQATRRVGGELAVGGVLLALSVLASDPVALVGAAGVGAWFLAREAVALREFEAVERTLSLSADPVRKAVEVDGDVRVVLSVERGDDTDATVRVTSRAPVSARGPSAAERTVTLDAETREARASITYTMPIAGRFEFPPPRVELVSGDGRFSESLELGSSETVTVEPRRPRRVHVGQGGRRIAAAFGEHTADRGPSGIQPSEIRPYVPGDATRRIDWKATARLGDPHVREFETETDRQTVLVVDHRGSMASGPAGRTMLDFAREVALGYVRAAESSDDPLGLYAVGDEGVTVEHYPTATPRGYRTIRDVLRGLEPTEGSRSSPTALDSLTRPADARATGALLANEETAFARTVRPFLDDPDTYVERIEGDPLFGAVRRLQSEVAGTNWTVIVTDDRERNRVREAVRLASSSEDAVLVFLTPRLLFEEDALGDVEASYERYVDFEEFRRELDRLPRVTVFEVGPGDRLDALLSARRGRV